MPLNGIYQLFRPHIYDMSGEDQNVASRVDAESTVPGQKEAESENDMMNFFLYIYIYPTWKFSTIRSTDRVRIER